jgi:hypothetical protein
MAATIVEWDKLLEVVVNASAAGIGVAAVSAVAIHGATRMLDMSREGRAAAAAGFGTLAAVAFAAVLAAIVLGIVVMTSK